MTVPKTAKKLRFLLFPFLALAAVALVATACGDDDDDDDARAEAVANLEVTDAYAQFSKDDLGAAYFEVNTGGEDDELTGVSTTIGTAELHTMVMDGATAAMQRVDEIELPENSLTELRPGSYHVMLMEVTDRPEPGESFRLTLEFEEAGELTIDVMTREFGAAAAPGDDGHDHDDHDHGDADDQAGS